MKVATYSRVSTTKREQKPEVQIQELRRYCKARRYKIDREIVHAVGLTIGQDSINFFSSSERGKWMP